MLATYQLLYINVYSHLLYGNLKVRDDITFENESKPKSEMNVDLVAKMVTQKIAQVLLNSKNGITSVEKLISSFEVRK